MTSPTFFLILVLFGCLFCLAFVLSTSICSLIRRFGPLFGLVDKPGQRKIHETVMPTAGGLGIWTGVAVPIFALLLFLLTDSSGEFVRNALLIFSSDTAELWTKHMSGLQFASGKVLSLLGLASVLVVLGTLDDRFGLGWKIRFFVQFVVAGVAVFLGWRGTFFIDIPLLTVCLSILWIVGLTNSFNLLDNMNGLSGGVGLIAALFFAVVLLTVPNDLSGEPQLFLSAFMILLAGAIFGFLRLNFPTAHLFMGNGGAYFVGFLLASTTLGGSFVGENNPKQAIFVPICILSVPIYDTVSVVLIRLKNGKSPFVGDKNHFSHRLVDLGLSRTNAVLTIYLTVIITSVSAIVLYHVPGWTAVLVFVQVFLTMFLLAILEFTARRKNKEFEVLKKNIQNQENEQQNSKDGKI